jgi:hypothetical protein
MSAGTRAVKYSVVAVLLAVIIIVSSAYYVSLPTTSTPSSNSTTNSLASGQSVVVVQLTDPPQVPVGTSSLNLTYSAVNLLVSEPAFNGQVTISSVSITPSGGSATVDLVNLQNVSQTIASANLPTGSAIYTIGFTVESVAINVNGTVYEVSLATGGTALVATLVHPVSVNESAAVLLELNPVVVNTPTGYQLIPSMVGVLKPQSEYRSDDQSVGAKDQISQKDQQELEQASGQAGRLEGW